MKLPIIVLSGPTASGKTAMSFELAKKFNGEIVAVDSMTVYRGLDIGTDKPTATEASVVKNSDGTYQINGVIHHLFDVIEPNDEMNAAILKDRIKIAVEKIWSGGKIPFLVGGSALYLDTFVYNYQMPEVKPNEDLRRELDQKTCEELFKELVELDPDCEWTIDRNNKRRIIRALEVVKITGQSFCSHQAKSSKPDNILYLAVNKDREELYAKINKRVDEMMKSGFLEEVKALQNNYPGSIALQAAGYKQLADYLEGKVNFDEAVGKTKQIHRNFAKRQMTWFKKNSDINWVENRQEAERLIKDFLSKKEYTFR